MTYKDLEHILIKVEKPSRYLGGEIGAVTKTKQVTVRFAFCFPDTYEIGMSHLGIKILYEIINKLKFCFCERVFMPWLDFAKIMKTEDIPLYALESFDPLYEFDIIGFTLQYELSYTNVLKMLELGNIPIFSKDRRGLKNLVIAGGPCVCNPEPMSEFIDVFLLGEGEYQIKEFVNLYNIAKSNRWSKQKFLVEATAIKGVYVPSFYNVLYNKDKTINKIEINHEVLKGDKNASSKIPEKIEKATVKNLNKAPFLNKTIIPYTKIIHDRTTIELMRGCIRGCRFCQAGFIYRPMRERKPNTLYKQAKKLLKSSGYDELSLSSLSTSDYKYLDDLLNKLNKYCVKNRINISLPSLRVDNISDDLIDKTTKVKKSGLTFAAEAGTQRLRDVINKNVTQEDILKTCEIAFRGGYSKVKLYFMIGLPTETMKDLKGIAQLSNKITDLYYKIKSKKQGRLLITINISTFVPKPFTPFQWVGQSNLSEIDDKQKELLKLLSSKNIKLSYHNKQVSQLEAVLARGDRKVAKAIYSAYKKGCMLDTWDECFDYKKWEKAFEENDLTMEFYANRNRELDEKLPWSHLDYCVNKNYLIKEYKKAKKEEVTENCRLNCQICGANKTIRRKCFE